MAISNFDKTRQNIRANDLSDIDRKELMKKFVDHGGQVITEKRSRAITIDREKQLEIRKQLDNHREKVVKKGSVKSVNKKLVSQSAKSKTPVKGRNPVSIFFQIFRIRFMLFMLGVTDFSASIIKKGFFEQFSAEFKSALLEIQNTYIRVFKAISPDVSIKIVNALDKASPLHFELIEMGAAIYNNDYASELLDEFIAFRDKIFYPSDIANPITFFFEKTIYLNSYQELLFSSYDRAMTLASKMNKDFAAVYPQTKKRLRNSIYIIFNRMFPKLYWLVCYYNSCILPLFDLKEVESILGLSAESRPGNRIANAPGMLDGVLSIKQLRNAAPDESESEQAREELKKKSAPKISEEVKRGLVLHAHIDRKSLAKKFIKSQTLIQLYSSDPIIRSYLVFREFDEEYSVLLATNKIKINTSTDWHEAKHSYREKLQTLFNNIRNCDKSFEDYFSLIDIFEKVRSDKPVSQQQYMSYSKRLTELEKEISISGKNVRALIRQFMADLTDLFTELNTDMENEQKIVANPQDEIEFDFIEGTKKLQKKKIFQSINMTVDFALAFIYRLSPGGDLYPDQKQKTDDVHLQDEVASDKDLLEQALIKDEANNNSPASDNKESPTEPDIIS